MVLSACSPAYAGVLEIFRKKYIESHGYIQQTLAGEYFNASKISMFVQVPEFIFDGSSEVFVIVSGNTVFIISLILKRECIQKDK